MFGIQYTFLQSKCLDACESSLIRGKLRKIIKQIFDTKSQLPVNGNKEIKTRRRRKKEHQSNLKQQKQLSTSLMWKSRQGRRSGPKNEVKVKLPSPILVDDIYYFNTINEWIGNINAFF